MLMQNEIPGMGRRLVGLVVDLFMLLLAHVPISLALREMTPSPVAVLVLDYCILLVYSTVFLSRRGQTPGKVMTSLRVISADGGVVTQQQAFIRALVKWTPILGVVVLQALIAPPSLDLQVAPEPDVGLGDVGLKGALVEVIQLGIWLALVLITRRHPDRQAPHDRVAATLVMRLP